MSYEQVVTPMGHFGRFHPDAPGTSRYSAALICLEKSTLLFENPIAPVPLSNTLRRMLTKLPWFDINHTIANWQSGDAQRAINLSRSMIEALRLTT
jgi:hypothetical protein